MARNINTYAMITDSQSSLIFVFMFFSPELGQIFEKVEQDKILKHWTGTLPGYASPSLNLAQALEKYPNAPPSSTDSQAEKDGYLRKDSS